jgi:hypothetical protein
MKALGIPNTLNLGIPKIFNGYENYWCVNIKFRVGIKTIKKPLFLETIWFGTIKGLSILTNLPPCFKIFQFESHRNFFCKTILTKNFRSIFYMVTF